MKPLEAKILDPTHLELSQPLPEGLLGRIEILVLSAGDGTRPPDTLARTTSGPSTAPPEATAEPSGGAVPGSRLRPREDAWCRAHPEIIDSFAGQWVIVEGEEIVAHGKDPAQLVKEARARGVRIPYVFYVEELRPDVIRLGLQD